ncbi:DMT family transporter [Zavarzinella formosa]|uniref:DMT family transporter n=1 Tax=Zavarzinella formosa TaxID=360055 RepID=UPI0003809BF9|nr:multidrug efflux SMR transporter [Zavarzinella formosa]
MTNWILLVVAGLLEVGWAIGLHYTEGFTKPWPTVLTVIGMIASVFCLALAVRTIPLGTGYAIWTGIGAVGAVSLSIYLFNESASPSKLIFMAIIMLGILGLKMSSDH